ncbi:MAG TPA: AAA family ATPase, partial [Anaerolineales bacterium]|nr:AAA family ATPase [Anaerolineales bacterium]
VWEVIPFQQQEQRNPQKINATERRLLGVLRIGNYVEADLTWGKHSAMSRMTENVDQISEMLAGLERVILNASGNADLSTLDGAIQGFEENCQAFGVDRDGKVQAGIDPSRVSLRQGAVTLLDGNLPLTLRGAGSRRLMSMAANKASIKDGAIILIDEIENSLEPYRLRHLIRQLRPTKDETHQVIFSTHSSVTVVECKADELFVVRNEVGNISIKQVGAALQNIVRKVPEAFLAKKIIVCEGKTEDGFLIGLDKEYWEPKRQGKRKKYQNLAEAGTTPVSAPRGGGDESPKIAVDLANLDYQVTFFGDSDKVDKLKPSIAEMKLSAVNVILWEVNDGKGLSIEERLCLDLPLEALSEIVECAVMIKIVDNSSEQQQPLESVWNEIYRHITVSPHDKNFQTLENQVEESDLRRGLGKAACKGEWFKRRDKGEHLAKLVTRYLNQMESTPTMKTLNQLEAWCYE